MLHKPYMGFEGDDVDFAKRSLLLSDMTTNMVNAYARKTGKSASDIRGILSTETFMDATTALANGFVDRITQAPVMGRVFAKVKTMPHGIVQALFGPGLGGDKREPTKDKSMSESQVPVAATVKQIKAAFPKAKSDFIVKCMEQQMPMEKVATEVVEETMNENDQLVARVVALEGEIAAMKALAVLPPVEEVVPPVAVAPLAKAKSGVAPMAQAKSKPVVSAKKTWSDLIQAKVTAGMPRAKAATSVNKENPGLREQMLDEVNA